MRIGLRAWFTSPTAAGPPVLKVLAREPAVKAGKRVAIIVATVAACAACQSTAGGTGGSTGGSGGSGGAGVQQSCDVEFDPMAIQRDPHDAAQTAVGGSAWATCKEDHLPIRHHMALFMEYQPLAARGTDSWVTVASNDTDQIPRDSLTAIHQAVTVIVTAPCQAGVFRMRIAVDGAMPDTGVWPTYYRTSGTYEIDNPDRCKKVK